MAVFTKESELGREQKQMADTSAMKFKKGLGGLAQRYAAGYAGYNPITGKRMKGAASKVSAWAAAFDPAGAAAATAYLQQTTKGTKGAQYDNKAIKERGKESVGVHNVIGSNVLKIWGINIDGQNIAKQFEKVESEKKANKILNDKSGYSSAQENIGVSPMEIDNIDLMSEEDPNMVYPSSMKQTQQADVLYGSEDNLQTQDQYYDTKNEQTINRVEKPVAKSILKYGGKLKYYKGGGEVNEKTRLTKAIESNVADKGMRSALVGKVNDLYSQAEESLYSDPAYQKVTNFVEKNPEEFQKLLTKVGYTAGKELNDIDPKLLIDELKNTVGIDKDIAKGAVSKMGLSWLEEKAAEVAISAFFKNGGKLAQGFKSKGMVDYAHGGMTKGAYNHETNPLTVVDKEGNPVGMELTGGEGVFDKPAMNKIEVLAKNGNYGALGKFVKQEMETWKEGSTMAVEGAKINAIKEGIASVESRGSKNPYGAYNESTTASGKYQFIWESKIWGGWGDKIMKVTGVKSQQEFLDNPEAQEKFMEYHIENNLVPSAEKVFNENPNVKLSHEELMALVHFQGEEGANIYLKTGKDQGGKNVSVDEYLDIFNKGYVSGGGDIDIATLFPNASEEQLEIIKNIQEGNQYSSESVQKLQSALKTMQGTKLTEEEKREVEITRKKIFDLQTEVQNGYKTEEEIQPELKTLKKQEIELQGKLINGDHEIAKSLEQNISPLIKEVRNEIEEEYKKTGDKLQYDSDIESLNTFTQNSNNFIQDSNKIYKTWNKWNESYQNLGYENAYGKNIKDVELEHNKALRESNFNLAKSNMELAEKNLNKWVKVKENAIKQWEGKTVDEKSKEALLVEFDKKIENAKKIYQTKYDESKAEYESKKSDWDAAQEKYGDWLLVQGQDDAILAYESTPLSLEADVDYGVNYTDLEEEAYGKRKEEYIEETKEELAEYDNVSSEDASNQSSQAPVSTMTAEEVGRLERDNYDTARTTGLGKAIDMFGGIDGAMQLTKK